MKYPSSTGETSPEGYIGWCHHCGLIQRGEDSIYGTPAWAADSHYFGDLYACANPDCGEAWGIGVWPMTCSDHERPDVVDALGSKPDQPLDGCECASYGRAA